MKVKNSYTGGLDQDISKQKYPENKVYDCFDFRVLTDEGLSTGALENVKGNLLDFDIISDLIAQGITVTTDIKVIGSSLVREETVLFAVNEVAGIDYIIKSFKNNLGLKEVKCIWLSSATTGRLNFSAAYPITDEVPRYENSNVKKTYFTDNNNPLRWLNIKTLEDDIDSNGGISSTLNAVSFDIVPVSSLTIPKLVEVTTGGARKSGVIQYYYQVYFPNGSISNLSPGTGMIHLTSASEQIIANPWSQDYFGEDPGIDTGKTVKILIDGIPSNFDRVRIIAAHYSTYFDTPIIEIVYEGSLSNGSISFIDTGNTVLGNYTLEELRLLEKGEFTCKGLTTKNNYLIAANIKELILDNNQIRNYDTRVYRYNDLGVSFVYEEDGSYYEIDGIGNWKHWELNQSGVWAITSYSNNANYDLPEDADCINYYNLNSNDNAGLHNYRYLANGTTIGAVGKNITVTCGIKQLSEAAASGAATWYVKPENQDYVLNGITYNNNSYPNYSSPLIRDLYVGYKRGEVYRIGTRFKDSKGRKSFVKWICDFRMPLCGNLNDTETYKTTFNSSKNDYLLTNLRNEFTAQDEAAIKTNVLHLKIAINNYNDIPDDPFIVGQKCSIEIVRAERNQEDKTILCSGYLNRILGILQNDYITEYAGSPYGGHSIGAPGSTSLQPKIMFGSHSWIASDQNPFYSLYSPEISYFNNIKLQPNDKIWVQQLFQKARGNPNNTTYYVQARKSMFSNNYQYPATSERTILDSKYAPWHRHSSSVTVGGIPVLNAYRGVNSIPSKNMWAQAGSNIVLQLNSQISNYGDVWTYNNIAAFTLAYVDVVRPLTKQYGGSSYDNRKLTPYITTTALHLPLATSLDFDVFGGDTFLGLYEFMSAMWTDGTSNQEGYVCSVMGVVESTINGAIQSSEYTFKNVPTYKIQEDAGIYTLEGLTVTQVEDIFLYNSVYSKQNNTLVSYEMPIDFNSDDRVDVMARISEKKFNGELFDSWLVWPINDSIEIDTQYGPITGIDMCFDRIFTIQEKAVSIITLVEDQSQLTLSLGAGTKLNKYDYVTTKSGSKHQQSIIVGRKGLYYYDVLNDSIQSIKGISPEVTIPGLSSFLSYNTPQSIYDSDNPFLVGSGSVLAVLDINFDEILFTFKDVKKTFDPSTEEFTLAVNESSGLFHHRYGCYPDLWIPGNGEYFSMEQRYNVSQRGKLYLHNKGLRGVWYDQPATDSYVILLINPLKGGISIYNNLTWFTEVTNAGVDVYDLTLTSYRAWNDYQNTGTIILDNNNIDSVGAEQRIMRQWKADIERDTSVGAVDEPRMRDSYILLQLNFTNGQNGQDLRIVLHDIITSITPSSF